MGRGKGIFFMYGFHIHIARKMCTLRFKGHIVMNPIFVIFFLFSLHVTSSSNITSVYSAEHIPGVKKQSQHVFLAIKFTAYNSGGTYV